MKNKSHKTEGAAAVACSDLLGSKSYKLIKCLQNNIAGLLLLPIFCLQTPKSVGQSIKSLSISENITHSLNLGLEGGNLSSVSLLRCRANTETPSGQRGIFYLGTPSTKECEKILSLAFVSNFRSASSIVENALSLTVFGQEMGGDGNRKPTDNAGSEVAPVKKMNWFWDHFFSGVAGAIAYIVVKALLPNDPSSTTATTNAAEAGQNQNDSNAK